MNNPNLDANPTIEDSIAAEVVPSDDQYKNKTTFQPAGPWRRLAASIVDNFLFGLIIFPVLVIFTSLNDILLFSGDFEKNIDQLVEQYPNFALVILLAYLAYAVVFTVIKGGTPGKFYLYHFNVVNFQTQQRIGYGRAVARESSKILYNIPLLGTLLSLTSGCMVLIRNDRRAIHDFIAGTQVVKVEK